MTGAGKRGAHLGALTREQPLYFRGAADGFVAVRLLLYRVGVLLLAEDTRKRFWDASEAWRNGAMKGVYHNGTLVCDSRSADRTIC